MPSSPHRPAYSPRLRDALLSSFRGTMPPVRISVGYRIGLALVALAMLILPLIYLALVALSGWALVHHASANLKPIFDTLSGRSAVVVYVAPLVMGTVVFFFLVKPLFSRPPKGLPPRSLDPKAEPLLFAFVERLCRTVGAPVPRRIDVDCQVNASASFRRGAWSFFSDDLVLTVGLPLVRGMSLQQLSGILAHEFGHFAQGAGMRLSYVIRSVNHWFARVVYQRDSWDEGLARHTKLTEDNSWFIVLCALLAQGMVWLTRRILWVLMQVGHILSCFLMRQMEFDADRYEARLVGADVFEASAKDLALLTVAHSHSLTDLSESWQEGRLVNSLPDLVQARRKLLPADVRGMILKAQRERPTELFDTHPSDRDRIRSARNETSAPIFSSTLPATALFRDFDSLAVDISKSFYEMHVGHPISPEDLAPAEDILERQVASFEFHRAFEKMFGQGLDADRALVFPKEGSNGSAIVTDDASPPDIGALAGTLELLRLEAAEGSATYERQAAGFEQAFQRHLQLAAADDLVTAKVQIPPKSLDLSQSDGATIGRNLSRIERRLEQLHGPMKAHEDLLARRILTALRVLDLAALVARRPELEAARDRRDLLLNTARRLGEHRERLLDLRRNGFRFAVVGSTAAENPDHVELNDAFEEVSRCLSEGLIALHGALVGTPYPFDHRDPELSIGGWLVSAPPETLEGEALYVQAQTAQANYHELYRKVLGNLAHLVELCESELGFESEPNSVPTTPSRQTA